MPEIEKKEKTFQDIFKEVKEKQQEEIKVPDFLNKEEQEDEINKGLTDVEFKNMEPTNTISNQNSNKTPFFNREVEELERDIAKESAEYEAKKNHSKNKEKNNNFISFLKNLFDKIKKPLAAIRNEFIYIISPKSVKEKMIEFENESVRDERKEDSQTMEKKRDIINTPEPNELLGEINKIIEKQMTKDEKILELAKLAAKKNKKFDAQLSNGACIRFNPMNQVDEKNKIIIDIQYAEQKFNSKNAEPVYVFKNIAGYEINKKNGKVLMEDTKRLISILEKNDFNKNFTAIGEKAKIEEEIETLSYGKKDTSDERDFGKWSKEDMDAYNQALFSEDNKKISELIDKYNTVREENVSLNNEEYINIPADMQTGLFANTEVSYSREAESAIYELTLFKETIPEYSETSILSVPGFSYDMWSKEDKIGLKKAFDDKDFTKVMQYENKYHIILNENDYDKNHNEVPIIEIKTLHDKVSFVQWNQEDKATVSEIIFGGAEDNGKLDKLLEKYEQNFEEIIPDSQMYYNFIHDIEPENMKEFEPSAFDEVISTEYNMENEIDSNAQYNENVQENFEHEDR